jgi:DNA modification methylase
LNLALTHGPGCVTERCAAGCPVADLAANARYFPAFRYQPKAPASERPRGPDGQGHATVKPLELMRWLVRLVTAPGGLVLDPFAGTGTTLQAALAEGMRAVGIEQDPDHAALARARLSTPMQLTLA